MTRADIAALSGQGAPASLVACDLEEADLSGLDLSGWVFERCSLRRTHLTGSSLEATRWTGCRGGFADFVGADLTEATIGSSDFNNTNFRGVKLSAATVRGCKMTGANFAEAQTLGAVFEETLFIDAKLPSFIFRKQTLKRLDFGQADLRKCDFREAVLEACSLRDAHLADARFEGADLRGADLGGIRLIDASAFRGAIISRGQAGQLLAELGLTVR